MKIDHLKEPTYLHFSEKYHPLWMLKVGDFTWWSAHEKEYFIDTKIHTKNQAQLNDFFLDPKTIVEQTDSSEYVKHEDGSISFTSTIYFKPQSSLDLGMIISAFSAVSVIALIVFLSFVPILKNTFTQKET